MKIQEFLEQWAGKWFAQRTSYLLKQTVVENSKAEITVESLPLNSPEVLQLCEQYTVTPSLSLGALRISWDNSVDWGKSKELGSNLLVFLETGKLLQPAWLGEYSLGEDEALTLNLTTLDFAATERISFASPNLKLRSVLTKYSTGITQTAFYTEIRKVVNTT
jgi:hypothetical protein